MKVKKKKKGNFLSIVTAYILVQSFLCGYMFRLVASHHQTKERNDSPKQLYIYT
jgi:flagellar basal body-associated protein FliL